MAGSLSAAALKKLSKELADLSANAPEGIRVLLDEGDLSNVQAVLEGPPGTPFAGGQFTMKLQLPADFPESPPKGYFLTKIWHPNVSKSGEICVNVLKKDWSPELGLRHVLLVIRCLLIEPFPESALNEEAGKALLEDYEEYCKYARLMTELHANPAKRGGGQGPLATGSGANAAADGGGGGGGEGPGSPAVKKAKAAGGGGGKAPAAAAAALKSKKSLKRL